MSSTKPYKCLECDSDILFSCPQCQLNMYCHKCNAFCYKCIKKDKPNNKDFYLQCHTFMAFIKIFMIFAVLFYYGIIGAH